MTFGNLIQPQLLGLQNGGRSHMTTARTQYFQKIPELWRIIFCGKLGGRPGAF